MGVIAHTLSHNFIFDKLHHLCKCSSERGFPPEGGTVKIPANASTIIVKVICSPSRDHAGVA